MKIRRILSSIWNEFIYGGHLLSLGASGIVLTILILLNQKIDWQILIVPYLISQIVYSYNHFAEVEKDLRTNPERAEYLQKIKKYSILLFLIYIFVLLFVVIYISNLNFFLFILFLFVIGILYTKFFKGLTKRFPGFKNFYVSFAWAFGIVFLTLFYYSFSFNLFFLLIFLFIFFRLMLDIIFFDLKDVEGDKKENLLTLPVRYGEKKTLQFLYFLNVFSFFPLFLGVYLKIFPLFALGLIVLYFYSLYYLKKAEKIDQKGLRQLSYIMVDGQYILWPLVLFLAKSLI